jgi:ubiquinol-cytochrome c reductase cytochrome c1 subunit
MRRLLLAAAALTALSGAATSGSALAQENALPKQNWSFDGIFGTFDRASAQRGFQVYQEVCSNCHSLKQAYYRNLEGIGFSPAQVKAIAASVQISGSTDDSGPIISNRRSPTIKPHGPRITVRCRRINPCWSKRGKVVRITFSIC